MLKLSKKEYLQKAKDTYEYLCMAENHRDKIQYQIKLALDAGFNVAVIGHEARVTLKKEKSRD